MCPNGMINDYLLYYRQSDTLQVVPVSSINYLNVIIILLEQSIGELLPFMNYAIHVQARVSTGLLGQIEKEVLVRTLSDVDVDVPTAPPTTSPLEPPSKSQITYLIGDPTQIDTGRVILCAVVVVVGQIGSDLSIYNSVGIYSDGDSPYITAAWGENDVYSNRVPSQIIVGDGEEYVVTVGGIQVNYKNLALKSNTQYSFFTRYDIRNELDANEPHRVFSTIVIAKTALPYNKSGLAVGIILALIALILLVVVLILLYRFRNRLAFYRKSRKLTYDISADAAGTFVAMDQVIVNPSSSMPRSYRNVHPVELDNFKAHVQKMHSNDDYLFSEEYGNLEPTTSRPSTEATHASYNTAKNRYANIPSYDHSRVLLSEIPERPGSDYINANHIDGYIKPQFIATQGPVPDSVPDFWRLVWEQNISIIVMVTNLEERGRVKCHRYWPSEKKSVFERISVELQEDQTLADYTIRTLSVQHEQDKMERIVLQFHFTVWPDHGVPIHPTSLLQFVRRVMVANHDTGPILVHCSAGVGRTGTFITLFTQLQRIQAENSVDIFNFVQNMRHNRCCMVQTEPQYVFIHDSLLESVECGVSDVPARDLQDQYRLLCMVDELVGLTGLEIEYDKLQSTIHKRATKTIGTLPVNKAKNRYANIDMIPYDNTRTRLSFVTGSEGSDYINANYIDGYLYRRAYIATQGPLPDTTEDFWRMVWEHKCATIVMLTKEKEGGRIKCHRYWPITGAESYGQYQVILHTETSYSDYTLREFKIVDTKDGSSLPVKQFQSTTWPEEGVPETSSALIDMIGQVQKWQMNSGNKPIVALCSAGTGRTGTFIAVSILLERLKTEGMVDVFHTVRALRLQRPNMVQTVDQYEFCFKTVLEYLDSFELYSNFK